MTKDEVLKIVAATGTASQAAHVTPHATGGAAQGSVSGGPVLVDAAALKTRAAERAALLSTPWERDIAQALADVQAALGTGEQSHRGSGDPLFVDARELFNREYPATPWLVQGLITRGGTGIIGAEPKAAKTWSGTEITIAVATGTPAFGEFSAERGRVAYFYAEDLAKQIRNRIRALLAGRGLGPEALEDRLHVQPRGRFLDLTDDKSLAMIVASCRRLGKLDLVVLDPLRDLHSGEEDKSDDMRDVMRRLRLVGELVGCTVLVVHHAAKAGADSKKRRPGQRLRGSGAIHGSVDCGIYLSDLEGDGAATFTNSVDVEVKGARGAGHFDLTLAVEDDEIGEATRATWRVVRDAARADRAGGLAAHQAQRDDDVALFMRVLRDQHAKKRSYTRRQWRGAEMRELMKHEPGGDPLPEKRVNAAIDAAVEKKLVHDERMDLATAYATRYAHLYPSPSGADLLHH